MENFWKVKTGQWMRDKKYTKGGLTFDYKKEYTSLKRAYGTGIREVKWH